MPIIVTCQCGKKFKTADQNGGKRARCPGCGKSILIPAAAVPSVKSIAAARPHPKEELFSLAGEEVFQPAIIPAPVAKAPAKISGAPADKRKRTTSPAAVPSLSISPGMVALIVLAILIPTGIFWAKEGPMKAAARWRNISEKAQDNITGQITRAITQKYKESGADVLDIKYPHKAMSLFFDEPVLMLKLPETISFQGKSTEGIFRGQFHPHTWQFEADVVIAGTDHKVIGNANENDLSLELDGAPVKD